MNLEKISKETQELIKYLENKNLKPQEKIAVLRSTAALIENVLTMESLVVMWTNALKK